MADVSKAVLVTGASSGIGKATALHFARKGWTTWASARRPETLADLEKAGCKTVALDVCDEDSRRAAIAEIEGESGGVGVLVNNAGYSQSGALEELEIERVRAQFETNVFGALRLTQLALPGMRRQRWGRVINVSSMGGRLVFPGGGAYHASKYAVEALSDALRFEVRGFGVHVVVIEPGLIRTNFAKAAVAAMEEPAEEETGPYGNFNDAVKKATEDAYVTPPMAWFGGGPESVARVIVKAAGKRRPRARYTVTPSAKMLIGMRRTLPDWAWDMFMRSQFPQPKGAR